MFGRINRVVPYSNRPNQFASHSISLIQPFQGKQFQRNKRTRSFHTKQLQRTGHSKGKDGDVLKNFKQQTLVQKVVFVLILLGCFGVCYYQVSQQIEYYLSYPSSFHVEILRTNTKNFPALYLCPLQFESTFYTNVQNLALKASNHLKVPKDEVQFIEWDKIKTRVQEVWDHEYLNPSEIQVKVECFAKPGQNSTCKGELQPVNATKELMDTALGKCLSVTVSSDIIEATGTKNLMLYISTRKQLKYFLQSGTELVSYNGFTRSKNLTTPLSINVYLQTQESEYLNHPFNPCMTGPEILQCQLDCIDKILYDQAECRLPFVDFQKKNCNTVEDIIVNYFRILKGYRTLNIHSCNCPRKCHSTFYSYYINTVDYKDNYSMIELKYLDELTQTIKEKYGYTFPSLLSDIGGSLGFYLGLSVTMIVELLEHIFILTNN